MAESLEDFYARIRVRDTKRSEATLQADIRSFILMAPLNLHEDRVHTVDMEAQLGDGTLRRIDVEAGNLIIEVKRDLTKAGILADAEKQLAGYLRQRSTSTGARYVGILTDGSLWRLYNLDVLDDADELTHVVEFRPLAGGLKKMVDWLDSVLAALDNLTPTPELIERHLGFDSPAFKLDHQSLTSMYRRTQKHPEVRLKKALWGRLLRTALGEQFTDADDLFCSHTLLGVEAAIIAHAVAGVDISTMSARDVLAGRAFEEAQIFNVVESDFFDWFLHSEEGEQLISQLIRELNRFAWKNVEHDVLKVLYESVISNRKDLGEYYTADWVAEKVVREAVTDPLNQSTLDAACGSGTFVFHSARLYLDAAESLGRDNATVLAGLQHSVFGMDIHPVSVILARVTYLMAIGQARLQSKRGSVVVPVYLGDSMQWSRDAAIENNLVTVSTDITLADMASAEQTEGQLALMSVSRELVFPITELTDENNRFDASRFDRIVADLADLAITYTNEADNTPNPLPIFKRHRINTKRDRDIFRTTFELMCQLNARKENHIWGYFVRNQARPLWLSMPDSQVDVLIGNPPWLSQRFMSSSMRTRFRELCTLRGLWVGGKNATHQDLVAMFAVRAIEKYLKPGGKFALVAPLAVLTRGHYEGFRSGRWKIPSSKAAVARDYVAAEFETPWSLRHIQPNLFPVPSCVLFGTRSTKPVRLPAKAIQYSAKLKSNSLKLADVAPLLEDKVVDLKQISASVTALSPYTDYARQGASLVPRFLIFVEPGATSALGGASGLTSVVSKRSQQEDKKYKELPGLSGKVEDKFVRPVLLGQSIGDFRIVDPWNGVLPIEDKRLMTKADIDAYSGLSKWWEQVAGVWTAHSGSTLDMFGSMDYHGKLTAQLESSFPHRIVYTTSGSRLSAARVLDKDAIVDTSLYWLPVKSAEEAHYIVAVLNAPSTTVGVEPYQPVGNNGTRHFHRMPFEYLNIEAFNPGNELHTRIAGLGKWAEEVAATVDVDGRNFVPARKLIRKALAEAGITEELDAAVLDLFGE
ncbi:Eco57I restriction-modification methylase domain-containing protein [Pseudarthrobacter sp. LMD1-1-1.1]|uniref:Eco57I restriction-modification methylase domain-containing protein n=1 Tax=Pseudarthrobacter sp. LMD1-1-1.1 TaxID=3135242 RepID=UPI0034319DA0